jgi:hypothetical protein
MQGWIDLFRSLGESLIEVLRAEVAALQEDLKRSGRSFGVALALFGAAVLLLFWILGLLVFSVVAILSIWLQTWAASLIVLALFSLVAGLLVWRGMAALRKVENPLDSVKKHVDDHLDWWQTHLLAESKALDVQGVASGSVNAADSLGEDLP